MLKFAANLSMMYTEHAFLDRCGGRRRWFCWRGMHVAV